MCAVTSDARTAPPTFSITCCFFNFAFACFICFFLDVLCLSGFFDSCVLVCLRAQSYAERLRLGLAVMHGEAHHSESDMADGRHSPPLSRTTTGHTGLELPCKTSRDTCLFWWIWSHDQKQHFVSFIDVCLWMHIMFKLFHSLFSGPPASYLNKECGFVVHHNSCARTERTPQQRERLHMLFIYLQSKSYLKDGLVWS